MILLHLILQIAQGFKLTNTLLKKLLFRHYIEFKEKENLENINKNNDTNSGNIEEKYDGYQDAFNLFNLLIIQHKNKRINKARNFIDNCIKGILII